VALQVTAIMLGVQDISVSELPAVLHAHAGLAIGFYRRLDYAECKPFAAGSPFQWSTCKGHSDGGCYPGLAGGPWL
jgi:hypothetical protein